MLRDPELLSRYRQGDQDAYIAIYQRYVLPLRRFLQGGFSFSSQGKLCRFKGADAGMDVEGLVQETFCRAFIKTTRQNYDGVRPFQTYLFSIAKNLVLRECYYKDRIIASDYVEEHEDSRSVFASFRDTHYEDNPEKKVINSELKGLLHQFICTLGEEQKAFFSLRFAKGFTQEATAVKMGTTRARIKLLEKQVRKEFLEKLRGRGYLVDYVPNPRWKRVCQPARAVNA